MCTALAKNCLQYTTAKTFIRFSQPKLHEIHIFFGSSSCSTREDLSIDVSITNVGLIAIDKVKVISALQYK